MNRATKLTIILNVDEIEARAHAAPPLPWGLETDYRNGDEWIKIPNGHNLLFGNLEGSAKCCYDLARFIVAARTDIPALVEEVRRLTTENAAQAAEIERLREDMAGIRLLATDYTRNDDERIALIGIRAKYALEGGKP